MLFLYRLSRTMIDRYSCPQSSLHPSSLVSSADVSPSSPCSRVHLRCLTCIRPQPAGSSSSPHCAFPYGMIADWILLIFLFAAIAIVPALQSPPSSTAMSPFQDLLNSGALHCTSSWSYPFADAGSASNGALIVREHSLPSRRARPPCALPPRLWHCSPRRLGEDPVEAVRRSGR